MFNVYVNYRLDPSCVAEAETVIRALMAQMTCRAGVEAQLLKKRDEPLLWMESYSGISDAESFLRELSSAANECDVGTYLNGERHVECFCVDTNR